MRPVTPGDSDWPGPPPSVCACGTCLPCAVRANAVQVEPDLEPESTTEPCVADDPELTIVCRVRVHPDGSVIGVSVSVAGGQEYDSGRSHFEHGHLGAEIEALFRLAGNRALMGK